MRRHHERMEEVRWMVSSRYVPDRGTVGERTAVLVGLAFAGWALCGMIMGVGMATTTMENALVLHALLAPVVFLGISALYFTRFNYTTPLETASLFVGFVIFMDATVVSVLINGSFDMFRSISGTWLVFAEIFAATLLTGWYLERRRAASGTGASAPVPT